jgi:hypothetical protein
MWKVGLLACSTDMLGFMVLRTGLGWAAWTGGGGLGPP